MDICLVTAPTAAEFKESAELSSECVRDVAMDPHLGVLSLAAVLEMRGASFRIVNLNRSYMEYATGSCDATAIAFAEVAASLIASTEATVYGFASICNSYPLTVRIAERVKSLRPSGLILFGGPQASVVDSQTLAAFAFVDLVLRGEAEYSLPILLDHVKRGLSLEKVHGLSFRVGGRLRKNPDAPVIQDLDLLPSPAYHLTDELLHAKRAALEIGRGCPFACTFCSTNDFFRRKFRLRSPRRVLSDMRAISRKYGISRFELVHDMFTVDRRRVVEFCNAMIDSGEGFTWSCSARTDCVDEEMLALMARAGCRGIFFGVESGSKKVQKIIDKDLNPERAREVITVAERLGIETTVSLITGFPQETMADLHDTLNVFMHSARCAQSSPQMNLLAPLAGTPIYVQHKNELILDELCSDVSHQGCRQDAADLELIRAYPDIFPNFYLIPCAQLDRSFLLELREFLLILDVGFRWLLVAIDGKTSNLLDVFSEWVEHRRRLRATLEGFDLRHYYRTEQFRMDFVSFLEGHAVSNVPAVAALIRCEAALRNAGSVGSLRAKEMMRVPVGAPMYWTDVPSRSKGTVVVELDFDVQELIETLKRKENYIWKQTAHCYATRAGQSGLRRLVRVSDWLAWIVKACDGRRTIQEILDDSCPTGICDLATELREYVCIRLVAGAQQQGFIVINRITSKDVDNHMGGSSICEYNTRSDVASEQNHRSIHAQ